MLLRSRINSEVTGATVTLRDLTITKGKGDSGGGIYRRGTLTLEDGTVIGGAGEGTTAAGAGGGLFHDGGAVTLRPGSLVTGNTASDGGGISNEQSSAWVTMEGNPSPIVVSNCPNNCAGAPINNCVTTPAFCPEEPDNFTLSPFTSPAVLPGW